ncbi:hypothetical protein P154DRAFT_585878 [Amniculicola lignicola CBS 123094]|uniref:Uncharacterized protein n=1 Tax=Amniculicola lignicola CBS 123094 TaxID=1392246 RepID=A0A6A5W5J8_9PLEO|nr:hypothetical protein P154DRAFT_585878 [Amniculicola lignicola CBS 123094]
MDLLQPSQMGALVGADYPRNKEQARYYRDHVRAVEWFIHSTLKSLTKDEIESTTGHMRKYVSWMQWQAIRSPVKLHLWSQTKRKEVDMRGKTSRESFFDWLGSLNVRGELVIKTGRQLLSIIYGHVGPLELLFKSGLIENFYEEAYEVSSSRQRLFNYVDALSHKNPVLKILEVGAGTSAWAGFILATTWPLRQLLFK